MGEHGVATSAGDLDARTIFVRRLPFSLSDSQLEEMFSEVGPVKHCFTVKEKGSEQHRGFGFVQFAVAEDAQKSVESKNGFILQGHKIKVEIAKRRPSLEERRKSRRDGNMDESTHTCEATGENTKRKSLEISMEDVNTKRKRIDVQESTKDGLEGANVPSIEISKKGSMKDESIQTCGATDENTEGKAREKRKRIDIQESRKDGLEGASVPSIGKFKKGAQMESKHVSISSRRIQKSSEKQRSARTVIVGGIGDSEVLESVLVIAKKVGIIEEIESSLTNENLNSHNLVKDGCKFPAAAIVYTSVRSAYQAVAALHQQRVKDCLIWARQLGGEGSKLKKFRLIVRNLPFQIEEASLRETFSLAGFVWEITIPRKPDGSSRGFSFIGYTSKGDADKAIKSLNGKLFGKRNIAVDWAVGKKDYETFVSRLDPECSAGHKSEDLTDNEAETASEDEYDSKSEKETDGDDHLKNKDDLSWNPPEQNIVSKVLGKILTKNIAKTDTDSPKQVAQTYTRDKNLKRGVQLSLEFDTENGDADIRKGEKLAKTETVARPAVGDLEKTVFIRNLPADITVTDLRRQFSSFGSVKSLRLVVHPITRRPKGTAFLEFDSVISVQNAVSAAKGSEEGKPGILFGGRALMIHSAVERDTARNISKQKSIEEHQDRRNLYLAKEGLIQEGTPAAEGISKGDIVKRKLLENEKATKLRSPNFHVSRTRLAFHNFPKTITEKEVKKLFIGAVKSRASKQLPVIKQVKILQDGGKSRGAGFVEFREHQHALVALRVLNNSPDVFGNEQRPIVEFAIENTLKLRERASRLALSKSQRQNYGVSHKRQNVLKNKLNQQLHKNDSGTTSETPKRSKKAPKSQLDSEVPISPKNPKHHSSSKTQKIRSKFGVISSSKPDLNMGGRSDTKPRKRMKTTSIGTSKPPTMENENFNSPALPYISQNSTKTHRRKSFRKVPASNLEDKLDKLVTEYRSKYFQHPLGRKNPDMGLPRTSENIKRWFE